jgi:hypothetical protein
MCERVECVSSVACGFSVLALKRTDERSSDTITRLLFPSNEDLAITVVAVTESSLALGHSDVACRAEACAADAPAQRCAMFREFCFFLRSQRFYAYCKRESCFLKNGRRN